MTRPDHPHAVVMNMFHSGLGIARSLGEQGVPVIGLSSQRQICGNFTRFASVEICPDSRNQPEALCAFLLELGHRLDSRAVIFPTRDDDAVFLNRFRQELEPYFVLTIPSSKILEASLDKLQTAQWAERAGVPGPKCWVVENRRELEEKLNEITLPCVLKPVAAHEWRRGSNWALVGGRKAIGIESATQLLEEYSAIERANPRAMVQEMIPGDDDALLIAACYLDRNAKWVAGFNTQKLIQEPAGFGTGCVVQTADCPEVLALARKLLETMAFTGIAEVEFKRDSRDGVYKLIEINPRPWDQHRLGWACGVDVIYLSYCEHAGLPLPVVRRSNVTWKWIADDAYFLTALRLLWRGDPRLKTLWRAARGKRTYAIGSWRDPLPLVAYVGLQLIPSLAGLGGQFVKSRILGLRAPAACATSVPGSGMQKGDTRG